jgi:hypothetical protein
MEDISSLSSATSSSPKITATLPMEVISTDARKLELLESRMSGKAVSDAITSIPPPQPSLVPAQDQVPETQVQANPNVEIEVVNRSSDSDDALRDMAVETNGTEVNNGLLICLIFIRFSSCFDRHQICCRYQFCKFILSYFIHSSVLYFTFVQIL